MLNNFENYSIYDIFVAFKESPEEGKRRPVAIVKIILDDFSVKGFGIY